jgi:molecular chaperone Hsp33
MALSPSEQTGTLHVGTAGEGDLRWALCDLTPLAEKARTHRDLSPLAAIGLGQMLTAAALLSRFLSKQPMRVVLDAAGDGPLGRIRAEADSLGRIRGLVAQHHARSPREADSGTPQLGNGSFRVVRQLHHRNYESRVALVGGGVARNVTHFLDQSEQIRSAVVLGVQARARGVVAAGGLVVEALPGADIALIRQLEARFASFPAAGQLLEQEGAWGLLDRALGELERESLEERHLLLTCDCDRDRFRQHLRLLLQQEQDLLEDDEPSLSVQCSFCGESYEFHADELQTLH